MLSTRLRNNRRIPVLVALAGIAIVSTILQPAFLSSGNALNIVIQATIPGVVAVGMTFVMIVGGIDLSVGSTVAFASIVLGLALANGVAPSLAVAAALTSGAAIGLINGILVNALGFAPFLATLGMMGVARGAAFLLSGGQPISGIATSLDILYVGRGLLFPASVYLLLVLLLVGSLTLRSTTLGRRLYAIGSNERAAALAGIRIQRYRILAYAIAGFGAALAGVLVTARLDSAQPLAGSLYELDAIAAVVIGGGSLTGGKGDLIGTALGVLLILVLRNAVTIVGLPTHAQPLVIGVLLLVVVGLDIQHSSRTLTGRIS
jgi:ribose transport system permease protein